MSLLNNFPSRVEGWLNVWDVEQEEVKVSDWKYQNGCIPSPSWVPKFCVIMENDAAMYFFNSESEAARYPSPRHIPRSRLDGDVNEFCSAWGYMPDTLIGSTLDLNGKDSTLESSAEDSWRRGGPIGAGASDSSSMEGTTTRLPPSGTSAGSKLMGFIKGGFMGSRTKSVTKLDRRKGSQQDLDTPSLSSQGTNAGKSFSLKRSLSLGRLSKRRRPSRAESPTPVAIGDPELDGDGDIASSVATRSSSLGQTRALSSECLGPEQVMPLTRPPPANGMPSRGRQANTLPVGCGPPDWTLGSDTLVQAVAPSLVAGRRHCYAITSGLTAAGGAPRSCFMSCRSEVEQRRWMKCLRRTAKPNLENERHRENSLRLCVQEAKNLPSKRRYFCDVCLDRTLYARTTSKPITQGVFWGEEFDLNNLPDVSMVTLNLYREAELSKDSKKKKKKSQNQLIAYVTIPVSDICKRTETQKWCPMQVAGGSGQGSQMSLANGDGGGGRVSTEAPQIRIKARYQSVDILPLSCYGNLRTFLTNEYAELVRHLEPVLSVRAKEEIASCMVNVHEKASSAPAFLADLVLQEILGLENESLVFRSNTIATKAMECYLKLVGGKYLNEMLQEYIHAVLISSDDCEVDPQKLSSSGQLGKNQAALANWAKALWSRIYQSDEYFPRELRSVFGALRACLESRKGWEFCDSLISSCLFLRLICPAVLSPCLFGLAQEFPEDGRLIRNMTLLAKSLQALANASPFGDKESYMRFLNAAFLQQEMARMRAFLRAVSMEIGPVAGPYSGCHDYIDLGYELAMLHGQLMEAVELIPKEKEAPCIQRLSSILREISSSLETFMPPPRRGLVIGGRSSLDSVSSQSSDVSCEMFAVPPTPPSGRLPSADYVDFTDTTEWGEHKSRETVSTYETRQEETTAPRGGGNYSNVKMQVNDDWTRILALADNLPSRMPGLPRDLDDGLYDPVANSNAETKRREEASTRSFDNPIYVSTWMNGQTRPRIVSASSSSQDPSSPPPPDLASITATIVPPPVDANEEPATSPFRRRRSLSPESHSPTPLRRPSAPDADVGGGQRRRAVGGPSEWRRSRGEAPQSPPGQPAVRMGVRSVQVQRVVREREKTSQEYENEISTLNRQLGETQSRLAAMERLLNQRESERAELQRLVAMATSPPVQSHGATSAGEGQQAISPTTASELHELIKRLRQVELGLRPVGETSVQARRHHEQTMRDLDSARADLMKELADVDSNSTSSNRSTYC